MFVELSLSEITCARLDEEQRRRMAKGLPNSWSEIVENTIARLYPLPKLKTHPVRETPQRQTNSPQQRQKGQKRWAGIPPEERREQMRKLAASAWSADPEKRRIEFARRRAQWAPRPPQPPKPPKIRREGKRQHVCRDHDRDYTAGRGLFGRFHGIFPQAEHVRGKNNEGVAFAPIPRRLSFES